MIKFQQNIDIEDIVYENTLKRYIETTISNIEDMENCMVMESSTDTVDSEIEKNIQNSINKIFGYTVQDIQGGTIPKKLMEQAATIKEIGDFIKSDNGSIDISKIKITCPNIWKYYEFVEELVENHIEKFTIDKSLNLFNRVTGTGRSIDVLTKNLNDMSAELRKSKIDAVKGMNKRANKLMKKNSVGSVADRLSKAVAPTVNTNSLNDAEEEGAYTESLNSMMLNSMDPVGLVNTMWNSPAMRAQRKMTNIYIGSVAAIVVSAVIISGLAAVHRFFKSCPTTIKMEKTTVGEVYTRLKALAPDRFLVHLAKVSKDAADAIGSKASITGFSISPDGHKGAVIYAGKINRLIKAYSKFYIALVDYYIKILRPIVH